MSRKPPPKEMSEDETQLIEELNSIMSQLTDPENMDKQAPLDALSTLIRTSTTSMTSVPKPLKHMRNRYLDLKKVYQEIPESQLRQKCADIISVLAMAATGLPEIGDYEILEWYMKGTQDKHSVGQWGHDYARKLEGQLIEQWEATGESPSWSLVKRLVHFDMTHNAEIEACDLLMELGRLELLDKYIDATNCLRIGRYLNSCSPFIETSEATSALERVLGYYNDHKHYALAVIVALQLNHRGPQIENTFNKCTDPLVKKQLAFMLARQQIILDNIEDEELRQIMSNSHVNEHFHLLAGELDIMEPKTPDEIFKTWLESAGILRPSARLESHLDSARHNLASSLVNGFVNAGFGKDKLVTGVNGSAWIYRNKDQGLMCASASLGLIYLWDIDCGLSPIDRYLYARDEWIRGGALLAIGLVSCGVRDECEPAEAILADHVLSELLPLRCGAVLGLGIAYSGSGNENVLKLISPAIEDTSRGVEMQAIASVASGLIAVGSSNHLATSPIINALINMDSKQLKDPHARLIPLALGLCQLGKRQDCETIIAALEVLEDPFRSQAQALVQMCAYAGTGEVLVIQEMLHICTEHSTASQENVTHKSDTTEDNLITQSVAVLAVASIAIREEIGLKMAHRLFAQLTQYGDCWVRRAIPLAYALTSMSNPQLNTIDILVKSSHDLDQTTAVNAILALGLVGAGTNNARVSAMLRQMAQYHARNSHHLFMVRVSQGLVHMGKGTLSLAPFHTDRQILNPVSLGALLALLVTCLDVKSTLLNKSPYLFYLLAPAMQPRWLVTLDTDLKPLPVSVRVGTAVDVVAKAGQPKTIAGIHTHTTPVLLQVGERAELANEDYEPLSPIMEGFVILRSIENK